MIVVLSTAVRDKCVALAPASSPKLRLLSSFAQNRGTVDLEPPWLDPTGLAAQHTNLSPSDYDRFLSAAKPALHSLAHTFSATPKRQRRYVTGKPKANIAVPKVSPGQGLERS